jgi:hypothetical protein
VSKIQIIMKKNILFIFLIFNFYSYPQYAVVVDDFNLGEKTLNDIFTKNEITFSSFIKNPSCNGSSTGAISIAATGGSGFYNYSLTDQNNLILYGPQSNNNFEELKARKYNILVKDMNNDASYANEEVILKEPSKLTLNGYESSDNGTSGYTISLEANGGSPPYMYSIFNPTSGSSISFAGNGIFTGLTPGQFYCFEVKDINACNAFVCSNDITLSNKDFNFRKLKYFPNPVQDRFYISNSRLIDAVLLHDLTGKSILSKNINALNSEIDLSNVSKGVYFLNIKSQGAEKIIRIIKE